MSRARGQVVRCVLVCDSLLSFLRLSPLPPTEYLRSGYGRGRQGCVSGAGPGEREAARQGGRRVLGSQRRELRRDVSLKRRGGVRGCGCRLGGRAVGGRWVIDGSFAGGLVCHGDRVRFCGTGVRSRRGLDGEGEVVCLRAMVIYGNEAGSDQRSQWCNAWGLDASSSWVVRS
jgi:hypothetical protein